MYTCSKCGAEVEIFSDELRVRCYKCKEFVYKEMTPSCIDWCGSAKECLGAERWNALQDARTDSGDEGKQKRKRGHNR